MVNSLRKKQALIEVKEKMKRTIKERDEKSDEAVSAIEAVQNLMQE